MAPRVTAREREHTEDGERERPRAEATVTAHWHGVEDVQVSATDRTPSVGAD